MIMDCRILTDTYVMLAKCEITKVAKLRVADCISVMTFCDGRYMHDVTPKVVAIAVRIVMAMWMIFFQISSLFIVVKLKNEN